MSFKAKKINIDLTLDLTEYIEEKDGGILNSNKTSGNDIFEWNKLCISEGERIQKLNDKIKNKDKDAMSLIDFATESRNSVIKQIDYFYDMGQGFYEPLLIQTIQDILEYIQSQVMPVKKKSQNYRK